MHRVEFAPNVGVMGRPRLADGVWPDGATLNGAGDGPAAVRRVLARPGACPPPSTMRATGTACPATCWPYRARAPTTTRARDLRL
jgi:hypothetical protein